MLIDLNHRGGDRLQSATIHTVKLSFTTLICLSHFGVESSKTRYVSSLLAAGHAVLLIWCVTALLLTFSVGTLWEIKTLRHVRTNTNPQAFFKYSSNESKWLLQHSWGNHIIIYIARGNFRCLGNSPKTLLEALF